MATGDKLVNLDVLKNTVHKEVVDLKSAFNAHFESINIITGILAGSFSGQSLTISASAGGSIVYFPVESGKKYTIVKPNTTLYWRMGYSSSVPAVGTTLTDYNGTASTSNAYATYTAPADGYLAVMVANVDISSKATFDAGVIAYAGEYNSSFNIYTSTLINTNVPVNINERLNQTDEDISALEAKDGYIENRIGFAYTDNDVINSNIRDCKIELFSNSVKKVVIDFPTNATTYLYIITYDSTDAQIDKKTCVYSVFYDADSKLFLVKTTDYRIRMILDNGFVSENHPAYTGVFGIPAYGDSKLFDEQNYPYDRHITGFAPNSSGDPLSNYLLLRDAIKEVYINSKPVTAISLVNNGYIQLRNGNTVFGSTQLKQNYVGTIWWDDYCGVYIDTTNIYGLIITANITKTGAEDNPMLSSRHVFYCGANREIKKLKAGIEAAEQFMDSILYVDDGTYDLIDEFGSDYFANLPDTDQQAGLKLFNKIHVIFSANSVVTAHYTGDNENVCTCFSPFNNGKYGFTLENLTLYSSRTRYGVHDVGTIMHNSAKYINCHIEQDNSENEYWPQSCAIGAGLGSKQDTEILNCIFKGQVYWHLLSDLSTTNYRGTVRCVDSYFIDNTIQVSASRADALRNTEFVLTGNSLKKISAADADGIVRTFIQDASADIYAWNNEVRT